MYIEKPYQGNMLDNLIASVQRAEVHAALAVDDQTPVQVAVHATYAYEFDSTYDSEAIFGVA